MIDCGEGTQTQLRHTHIHFAKLQAIFISHLHGDHCFGLLGLLSTFGMLGRTAPMHVYAPQEFETIFREQLAFFCATLGFEIVFHGLDTTQSKMIYEDRGLTVTTIPLQHRVPTCGFLFREKPKLPHVNRAMIDFYHVPVSQINNIKAGQDWVSPAGDVIPHEQLTTPADPTRLMPIAATRAIFPRCTLCCKTLMCFITRAPMQKIVQHMQKILAFHSEGSCHGGARCESGAIIIGALQLEV